MEPVAAGIEGMGPARLRPLAVIVPPLDLTGGAEARLGGGTVMG